MKCVLWMIGADRRRDLGSKQDRDWPVSRQGQGQGQSSSEWDRDTLSFDLLVEQSMMGQQNKAGLVRDKKIEIEQVHQLCAHHRFNKLDSGFTYP